MFAIPGGLFRRCAEEFGWCDATYNRVVIAYQQFMELKKQHEDWHAEIISPPVDVDKLWHEHILYVEHYVQSCHEYCGHLIGHDPDGAMDSAAHAERIKNTKISVKSRFDKNDIDNEIWSFDGTVANAVDQNNKRARIEQPAQQRQGTPGNTITLRFHFKDEVTFFKMGKHARIGKAFEAWAQRNGVNVSHYHFLLGCDKIGHEQTPFTLELNDDDEILVMKEQCGC